MSDVGIPESTARALLVLMATIPIASFIVAFLIGSIPFGYLIGRIFYHTDIRTRGSGNIGAMNALRTLGKGGAVAVLLLDALKGLVPTLFVVLLFRDRLDIEGLPPASQIIGAVVALGAVLGHCFSPWLGWKGGKGVATSFGAVFGLCWPAGLVVVAAWIAAAAITRYSSVGSMFGSIVAPFAIWFFSRSIPATLFGALSAVLIVFAHRENISRLRNGIEGPIQLFKRKT